MKPYADRADAKVTCQGHFLLGAAPSKRVCYELLQVVTSSCPRRLHFVDLLATGAAAAWQLANDSYWGQHPVRRCGMRLAGRFDCVLVRRLGRWCWSSVDNRVV